MPATLFGRYEIRQEIGRGGMAHVYLAFDPTFHREVAVKVLPPHYLENSLLRARFEREARLIATIEHPAIVPVYDFGQQENQLYLVMRYMAGGSLVDRIRQGAFTLSQASGYITQLAPALDAVHAREIVHRDLKPGNILLDSFGNPALSDFGIAHLSEATVDLTGEAIIGTPAYMSPEQVRGEVTLDGRSDIYSLGVILYEMLVGHQPYQATTPMSAAMRHLTDPIPQIGLERPELPPALQPVLERALAKDRDLRYSRATDLAFDLRALVDARHAAPGPARTLPAAAVTEVDTRPGYAAAPPPAARTAVGAPPGARPPAVPPAAPAANRSRSRSPLLWLGIIGGVFALALLVFMGIRLLSPPGSTPTPGLTSQAALATQPADESALPGAAQTSSGVETPNPATESTQAAVQATQPAGEPASSPTETAQPAAAPTSTAEAIGEPAAVPTQTAVAYPPPAASSTSPAASTPAFTDDFSTPANGWPQDRRVSGGYFYQDGAYIISVRENQQVYWAAPDNTFGDLQIQVAAQSLSDDQGYYGVLCRLQDSGDHYYFVTRPDGSYTIGIFLGGEFQGLLPDGWISHDAVQPGSAPNQLQADCDGDRLRFTVNGVLLEEITDTILASGKPGLIAATLGNQTFQAQFDNFLVFSPVP
jgi:tRNA A-37 threonylcarbamoyl transferase component Bud32